jgi:hypothetical protein
MHDNNGSDGGVCPLSLSHFHIDIYRLGKTIREEKTKMIATVAMNHLIAYIDIYRLGKTT